MSRLDGTSHNNHHDGVYSYSADPYPLQTFGLVLGAAAFLAYGHWKNNYANPIGGLQVNPVPVPLTEAQKREMREARLRQLEKPTEEPMPNPWAVNNT